MFIVCHRSGRKVEKLARRKNNCKWTLQLLKQLVYILLILLLINISFCSLCIGSVIDLTYISFTVHHCCQVLIDTLLDVLILFIKGGLGK